MYSAYFVSGAIAQAAIGITVGIGVAEDAFPVVGGILNDGAFVVAAAKLAEWIYWGNPIFAG